MSFASRIMTRRNLPTFVAGFYTIGRWHVGFCLLALLLGGLHTWVAITNHSMNADGINYLDMGDAFWRGDWSVAVNAVWSPLYGWLLGLVMRLCQPSMRWEFPLVHLTNFVIYGAALFCFCWFWGEMWQAHQEQVSAETDKPQQGWPVWIWWGLGYSLFIWSSLTLIEVWAVTPDMLMACWVYLAAALIVRLRRGRGNWWTSVLLGMVLGLAYLTKAIMFPVGLLFLTMSFFRSGPWRQRVAPLLVTTLFFGLIGGSWIAVLSEMRGRFTFSDASPITYLRYVGGLPYPHWQGGPAEFGVPLHPSQQINADPPIYSFATPVGGTYPISYDPFYWYEGVKTPFAPGAQLRQLLSGAVYYLNLFVYQQGVLVVMTVLLLGLMRPRTFHLFTWLHQHSLVLIALGTMGLYALVYVEGRYVAVFLVLFWADWLASVRLSQADLTGFRNLSGLSVVGSLMILFLWLQIVAFNLEGVSTLTGNQGDQAVPQPIGPTWPGEVAEALTVLGVKPGDQVGVIGYGFDSYWARLARVRITAEILGWQADPFWLGDAPFQTEVLKTFADSGVVAVVAEYVPTYAQMTGWQQVGESDFYIYRLNEGQQ